MPELPDVETFRDELILRGVSARTGTGPRKEVRLNGPSWEVRICLASCRIFTPEEWAEAAHDGVSLNEVRCALSTISGSLSEAVFALAQKR